MPTPGYSVHIAWSQPDEAYVATSAEWPGLSGVGHTYEEALGFLTEAIGVGLENCREDGEMPPPHIFKVQPGSERAASGDTPPRDPTLWPDDGAYIEFLEARSAGNYRLAVAYRDLLREYERVARTREGA